MPPQKDEPRLQGSTSSLDVNAPAPSEVDPIRALADLLLGGLRGHQQQQQPGEILKWQRRRVVLCLEDKTQREKVRNALDPTRYEVFSADFAPEAIEILHDSRAEIIVLSPTFDSEHQGGAAMMQYVNTLTANVRRRTYVILTSPQLRTLDTYLAFANGVNLTVHPEDIGSLQAIFERSSREFNELYRPLNQALNLSAF